MIFRVVLGPQINRPEDRKISCQTSNLIYDQHPHQSSTSVGPDEHDAW